MTPPARVTVLMIAIAVHTAAPAIVIAETLRPATTAAFDRYAAAAERHASASLSDHALFLATRDPVRLAALRRGELFIERVETMIAGRTMTIPDGLVHHWVGVVFVPGVTVDRAVALLQDYDRHATIFTPQVSRSKLIERTGDVFRMSLRFRTTHVITVVVNSVHEARFARIDATRAYSRIASTRVAEVEKPDTPDEREKPVGQGGGYLWRLHSHWRFLERDGGTYVQCESITLTRSLPRGPLGWIVKPFVTSIPRDSLTFTLEATRTALQQS